MTHDIDFDSIQRFVDREMGDAEFDAYLNQLDDDSPAWRSLTLALIERRLLEDALSGSSRSLDVPVTRATCDVTLRPATDSDRGFRRDHRNTWLAPAIGLVLAFVAGVWIGNGRGVVATQDRETGESATTEYASGDVSPASDSQGRVTHRIVDQKDESESDISPSGVADVPQRSNPQHAEPYQVAMPATNESSIESEGTAQDWQTMRQELQPEKLLTQNVISNDEWLFLLKSGYLVDETPEVVPVSIHEGPNINIPVNRVNIRYLGHQLFQ